MRRKTILNCLTSFLKTDKKETEKILSGLNIDVMLRPDKLTLETYKKIAEAVF
jgi:16S rRNA A1518/A1519 N6-dimethyltransferase RsmA/KsgA/DIM1 with predicted DNA glycosylase/AP lyase activity